MTEPGNPGEPDAAPPKSILRVLIVSDSPVVRAGLSSMLASSTLPVVAVEESDGLAGRDYFDAVVLSAEADEPSAADGILSAAELAEGMVLLTRNPPDDLPVLLSAAPGGWALLSPDTGPHELAAAVLAVSSGLVALSPGFAKTLRPEPDEPAASPLESGPLTPRELEVLALISAGLANKSIARALGISEHTVKFHISSIYTRLNVANRAEAVSVAARLGLITL
ncbi:response regulator transcription factor [Rubrobacter indicoceani]|uniref:response regulator transcription factor n=1 Tax=Rubrobacter indicoceani TaxID=2051957 RepID=UPI000E5A6248|nr:response regulator transcription factor [Rubrobacter indicoceani]